MKTPLLMLSAAGLVLAAQAAVAAPSAANAYVRQVDDLAAQEIAQAGVHVGYGLKLSAYVAEHGRLTEIRVIDTSGSRTVDRKVAEALARVRADAPPRLVGEEVQFAVRPGHIDVARAD